MKKTYSILILFLLFVFAVSYSKPETIQKNTIVGGTVTDSVTDRPVDNTHVYIVHGEEESLTNETGKFRIETSQKFPLTVTAEHAGYKKFRTVVKNANTVLAIKLKPDREN